MKKIFLLSLIAVTTMHASESTWDVSEVKFNREEFMSESGFLKRGILGYLCCACPQSATNSMRKRLKEKDLLYKGSPLTQFTDADQILDDFLVKRELSLLPFKGKKETGINNSLQYKAFVESILCTDTGHNMAISSMLLGALCGWVKGGCELAWPTESDKCACGVCFASCALCALPYTCAVSDSIHLYHGSKIGSDTPKED